MAGPAEDALKRLYKLDREDPTVRGVVCVTLLSVRVSCVFFV